MGYVARETSPYWPWLSGKIFISKRNIQRYFLLTKKVGWKSSTCNDRMVSTRNVQVAGYWITEFLGNVTHVQCRQVHDDSLLKSRGITVDIGYAASETKPDRPLIRHKMLHVIIEYFLSFFTRRIWLKTLNLQRRPVYTLPCPVQNFTIKTFESFNKRFITSATSWNDMHRFPWLSVTSTAWLQQCQWSSCCLCTQHLMWMCGCKAHCSLQCRNVQCNISQSQQFCFYGSSYLLPAGLTCVHFSFINLNCVLGTYRRNELPPSESVFGKFVPLVHNPESSQVLVHQCPPNVSVTTSDTWS